MTSQLPCFWCFYSAGSWEKDTENGAAVTSLRSFLFRDNFNTYRQALKARRIGGKDNDQIDIIEKNENMVSQQKDLEEKDEEIERLLKEMLDYKTKFEELMEENDELRKGMKQILEDVKEQDGQSDVLIHCPSLEKLVGM